MKKLNKKIKTNGGMTYVELIVVLSIFSIISSIVMFNYGDFESKVDIKNLASDVALQIVQAQKAALGGLLPPAAQQSLVIADWKPSYGIYFKTSDNSNFYYFVDLNNDSFYDLSNCVGVGECLSKVSITKNNTIQHLDVYYLDNTHASLSDLTIIFSRPNSGATIRSSSALTVDNISYVQITVVSSKLVPAYIRLYPSGRVQVN